MKIVFHVALLLLTILAWSGFVDRGRELDSLREQLERVVDRGYPKQEAQAIESEIVGVEGEKLVYGLLLTLMSAGVGGIFVGVYLIPFLAQKATHAIYDSGEMVDPVDDGMREARSLMARGDHEGALVTLRQVLIEDPGNRMAWLELAKIQRSQLEDPGSAIAVLHEALTAREWEVDDAAFLLFRVAEIHEKDLGDLAMARAVMQQVIDQFPQTRHAANATHKLRELDGAEPSSGGGSQV